MDYSLSSYDILKPILEEYFEDTKPSFKTKLSGLSLLFDKTKVKKRIWETLNLLTYADSRTNTKKSPKNLKRKK